MTKRAAAIEASKKIKEQSLPKRIVKKTAAPKKKSAKKSTPALVKKAANKAKAKKTAVTI